MGDLFSTKLTINDKITNYKVVFENEQYVFRSENKDSEFASFSFKREDDEWHEQDQLPDGLKNEAVQSLEKYLLSQH